MALDRINGRRLGGSGGVDVAGRGSVLEQLFRELEGHRTMNKLSPGDWHRGTGNGEGSIFTDKGRMRMEEGGSTLYPICKMVKGWDPAEDEANEIAVAAVPDLVSAAIFVLGLLNTLTTEEIAKGDDKFMRERLEAALRKAGVPV